MVFEEVVDLDPAERAARFDALAAGDPSLAAAVGELLAADARARDFLSNPLDLLLPRIAGGDDAPTRIAWPTVAARRSGTTA